MCDVEVCALKVTDDDGKAFITSGQVYLAGEGGRGERVGGREEREGGEGREGGREEGERGREEGRGEREGGREGRERVEVR